MRVLHHLEQSRSFRIMWALEELELDYEIKYYKRLPNYSAPPSLKQVHSLVKPRFWKIRIWYWLSLPPFWSISKKPMIRPISFSRSVPRTRRNTVTGCIMQKGL